MISREPVKKLDQITRHPEAARAYAPPTLEKMRKLAQVTGIPAMTGVPT